MIVLCNQYQIELIHLSDFVNLVFNRKNGSKNVQGQSWFYFHIPFLIFVFLLFPNFLSLEMK